MDNDNRVIPRSLVALLLCAAVVGGFPGSLGAQMLGPPTKVLTWVPKVPPASDGTWNITVTVTAYTNNVSGTTPPTPNCMATVAVWDHDTTTPDDSMSDGVWAPPVFSTWGLGSCGVIGTASGRFFQTITFTGTGISDKDWPDDSDIYVIVTAQIPYPPPATQPSYSGGKTSRADCNIPVGGALSTADWLVALPGFVEMNNLDGAKGLPIVGISRGWDEISALLADGHEWAMSPAPLLNPRQGLSAPLLYFRMEGGDKLLPDYAPGDPAQTEATGFAIQAGGELSAADIITWYEGPTPVTGLNVNHADPEGNGDPTLWHYFAFAGDPVVYVSSSGDPLEAVSFAMVPNLLEIAGLAVEDKGIRGVFEPGDRLLYSDPQSSAIFVLEAGQPPEVLTFGVNTFDGVSPLTIITNDDDRGRQTVIPGMFQALSVSTRNTACPAVLPDMCCGFCPDTECPEEKHTVSGDTLTVTVWDELSGLCSIQQVPSGTYNVNVTIPSFTPGTREEVVVTATKVDPNKSAGLMLDLKDCAQNSPCIVDPVMVTLTGEGGVGASEAFNVPSPDHFLYVDNQFARFVLLEINSTNRLVIPLDPTGGLVSFDLGPAFQLGQNTVRAFAPLGQGEKAYLYFFNRPLAD
ncbi:MAG: hypothetical protein HY812_22390 [Planctomycetes bacterium]|nr:hypothetical protein [Planctomycetota bacterium]